MFEIKDLFYLIIGIYSIKKCLDMLVYISNEYNKDK